MSLFTTYDFAESLGSVEFGLDQIDKVIAARGQSPDGWSSWEGDFIIQLKNGDLYHIDGWCDTTGWGCQDGCSCTKIDEQKRDELFSKLEDWTKDPPDLNLWVQRGRQKDDRFN